MSGATEEFIEMRVSFAALLSSAFLLAAAFATTSVESSSPTCRCEREENCDFLPYGKRPTDIRDFGTLRPCPFGRVVCCDRSR